MHCEPDASVRSTLHLEMHLTMLVLMMMRGSERDTVCALFSGKSDLGRRGFHSRVLVPALCCRNLDYLIDVSCTKNLPQFWIFSNLS